MKLLPYRLLLCVTAFSLFGLTLGLFESNWTLVETLDPDFWWDPVYLEPDCEEASDGTFAVSGGEDIALIVYQSVPVSRACFRS